MSTTDQAYIRAYGETVRANRTAAAATRAQLSPAELIDGILSQQAANWQKSQALEVGLNQANWMVHPASIDVGLNSAVPAPHFAQSRSATAGAIWETAAANESILLNTTKASRPSRGPSGMRRPVNMPQATFSNNEPSNHATPKAGFEIDAIRWPEICDTLLNRYSAPFSTLANDLRQEAAEGRKVLAVTGIGRGEGRTAFTLCLAKHLSTARIRVAIVDADFSSPALAKCLHIEAASGWEAALNEEQSIWEVMIESTGDHLSIVPLSQPNYGNPMPRPVFGIAALFGELAEQFDVVLIDAGPLEIDAAADWLLDPAAGVQSVIVAHDARRNQASRLAAACMRLAEAGVRQLGIAEMFGSQTTITKE